ncbi:hypothetical protein HN51_029230 [Arachis hypogaea]|uniref:F-box domain-containing protein n=1 Tax=Arachis hypogaea TaxID=3818 RepID=A0A445BFG0_ARAHY|nr:F-box/LRR-repeat protein At2g29930 [Arachis hypogaea]QHO35812.1 F-box/LRR-repeat protein [Arachis hypogaea]QHO35813.1 F-box/LRR-repeat protein [Arachis hypogaea]RYR37412.1 hypothetical protein Ahy_A09g042303 isoform A [Arachis hypogaea]RYR37413.1 hypothetical protein Ahy_A09g042303 isoform B [Arachis hypogaea]
MGRKKKSKKQRKGEGNSYESGMVMNICDLPDPILYHILSSLPTKDAIRTSVLSKMWEHLWKNISKIELRENYHSYPEQPEPVKRQKFMDFATKLLRDCDCSNLKKFDLICSVDENASQVNQWLCGFINPEIEELSLHFEDIWEPLVFPDHLFTCATLTQFDLRMKHIFKLPSSIHFQSLRMLRLVSVIFPDSSSTQNLFSGCPALEELALIYCNLKNVKAFFISSPLLQTIDIVDKEDEEDDGLNVSKKVVIFGTNLTSFNYSGDFPNEYSLCDSASVINASIMVQVPPSPNCWDDECMIYSRLLDLGRFVFKLLRELPNLEWLTISDDFVLALSRTRLLLKYLPFFPNLVELNFSSIDESIDLSYPGLLAMFHNSPNLEVIRFVKGVFLPKDDATCILDCIPMCFSTDLKLIEISGFDGEEEELFAIKVLLQSASVLSKLIIRSYFFRYNGDDIDRGERLDKLHQQILRYPRRSMDCEIDVEHIVIG